MRVVVYEPEGTARAALCEALRDGGHGVASFGDPRTALLFLLGRLREVDGIVVNVADRERGRWLVERLERVGEPLSVVTYSGDAGARGAQICGKLREG